MTSNSSKILSLLRKSPRSSDATPTPPARTPPGHPGDLDIPAPRDVSFQSIKADARSGALEMSIAVFREAASLASNIPYMGAVAGIIVQIIRIRDVRTFSFFSRRKHVTFGAEFVVFVMMDTRKSISIGRCGKM
jgi:hypothetical protein